jgi:hypothetical protein
LKLKKVPRFIILFLLILNGLGAIFAGYCFIREPNGLLIGMDKSILVHSPFKDFLIPGLILFVFNGLTSLIVLWQLLRNATYLGYFLFIQGCLSCGWIIVQMIMLRSFNILQIIFGLIGFVFFATGYFLLKRNHSKSKGNFS